MTRLARWGRGYFALQAVGGAAWWVAVFTWPAVREATLGTLEPVPVAAFDIPLFVVASGLASFGIRWAAVVATGWTLLVALALAVFATVTTDAGWGVLIMAAAAAGSALAFCAVVLGRIPTEWIVRGPFAFRPADGDRPAGAHVARTFGQIAVFWGLFLVLIPLVVASLEQRWRVGLGFGFAAPDTVPVTAAVALAVTVPIGVAVLVLASALGIWSAITMSTLGAGTPLPSAMPNRLVLAGPYRWVRNPMAVAGIVQGAAVGLILSSWLVIAYALAGSLLWNHIIRPHEEADLEHRFGAAFVRYGAAVRCWVPRLTPYRPPTATLDGIDPAAMAKSG